jgi:hypothetical protein
VLGVDDMWEPSGGALPPTPPGPPAPPPGPPAEPPPRPEFLRPGYLVALGALAALVLIVGLVVVLTRGEDDSITADPGTTVDRTTTPALTTTPPPLPSTTTTTSTTTSTSTTTTTSTTAPPIAAVADAGDDRFVSADVDVALAAIDLTEPNQSVVWRQTAGPDVTDGIGRLLGAEVTFRSPGRPATLGFEMSVTGRGGDVARDELRIDVLQQAGAALFVDGAGGSDDGDGSPGRPFRSLARALDAAGGGVDLYLRSIDAAYDTGDRTVAGGTSIFGGYDGEWVRDVDDRAVVTGANGIRVAGGGITILSALDIVGPDLPGPADAVHATGLDRLIIELSQVTAGASAGDRSTALTGRSIDEVLLVESVLRAGTAGPGAPGAPGESQGEPAPDGGAATARAGGPGAGDGGRGGDGGVGPAAGEDGGPGGDGGDGGEPGEAGAVGGGSDGGAGGTGGDGGRGAVAGPALDPTGAPGASGQDGEAAPGGWGGGGGGGLVAHDGGGGGGGGAGGTGGAGGGGGGGGHGSVGVLLVDVDRVVVRDTTIEGGAAGDGGAGGSGTAGGSGGAGGEGAEGVSTFLETAGSGGGGGGGGAGGTGAQGGGGAGGRSVGLLTADVGAVEVTGSRITGGAGGDAGDGGRGGARGADGADGNGRAGGSGGVGTEDDADPGASGALASGGDSIGWWDGGAARSTQGSVVTGGSPGAPDGRAADTEL